MLHDLTEHVQHGPQYVSQSSKKVPRKNENGLNEAVEEDSQRRFEEVVAENHDHARQDTQHDVAQDESEQLEHEDEREVQEDPQHAEELQPEILQPLLRSDEQRWRFTVPPTSAKRPRAHVCVLYLLDFDQAWILTQNGRVQGMPTNTGRQRRAIEHNSLIFRSMYIPAPSGILVELRKNSL